MEDNCDDATLLQMLHEATVVYGSVTGWTKVPWPVCKKVLKGHGKLLRELDALYVG